MLLYSTNGGYPMSFQFAYIPIGVPTFHLESAQNAFDDSVSLLKEIDPSVKRRTKCCSRSTS